MNFLSSLWRQRNYRAAIAVALVTLVWLASGLLGSDSTPQEPPDARPAGHGEGVQVRARRLDAQPYTARILVNSRTEANRSLRLRAELDGTVVSLPVAEGQWVSAGEVICELNAEDRPENLARARAALAKAELDYAGAQRLKNRGLQSDTGLAQQEVALAAARADFRSAQLAVDNLKIRAPFAGVVNRRPVELGDLMRRGDECATLLDLDPVLVVGEVSESQVDGLTEGGPASARLHGGRLLEGHLRYVSREADEITRGYRVEVAVDNPAGELRAGLSGRLALPAAEIMAHRVSSSLLTLDDSGRLGVRALDDEEEGLRRVRFFNVQLVGDAEQGVWVSGLPAQVTLITVGQEYVNAGDAVSAQLEPAAGDLPAPALDAASGALRGEGESR